MSKLTGTLGCVGLLVLLVIQAGGPIAAGVWGHRHWGGFWGAVGAGAIGTVAAGVITYGFMILFAVVGDTRGRAKDSRSSEAR